MYSFLNIYLFKNYTKHNIKCFKWTTGNTNEWLLVFVKFYFLINLFLKLI